MIADNQIQKIENNKDSYINFLLLADPSEKMVKDYLYKGDLYIIRNECDIICGTVVVADGDTVEIKNITTNPDYQKKGYGTKMIKYIIDTYSEFYNIIVGTAKTGIPGKEFYQFDFYRKCGFEEYRVVENFFIDNYPEPIFEDNGEQCIDMVYLRISKR